MMELDLWTVFWREERPCYQPSGYIPENMSDMPVKQEVWLVTPYLTMVPAAYTNGSQPFLR
jgi:hypothetical protein